MSEADARMRGKRALRVLISAGATREPIDPVRFLSNYSTGYMGARLAAEALRRGHRVRVISGPSVELLPAGAQVVPVVEAREMEQALRRAAGRADVIIMTAAVSDFRPARAATKKLRRRASLMLRLEATPDIIARLPRRKKRQLVVGFALESDRVAPRAAVKLRAKRLDLVVAQRVRPRSALRPERSRRTQRANGTGAPFGRHPVEAWLVGRETVTSLGRRSKAAVARVLLDKIEALWYGDPR